MPLQSVTVIPNPAGLIELAESEEIRSHIMRIGEEIAADARAHGPHAKKRSKHGVETIHAERGHEEGGRWSVDVGWDREKYYLRFPELGTRYQPARPFLVPAVDRYARMSSGVG